MGAGEVSTTSRGRKSSTPSGSSSRPSSTRPAPPKRAHTSAISTSTLRTITKNATASNANSINKAKSPLLTSPALVRSPHTIIPKTPSPNYFALKVEDDSNPPDSDAGKHAKRNWAAGSAEEDGDIPVEENPRYENFRRQSEHHNHFNLGHSGLSRFSTDGRVPTLKSFQVQNGADGRPPLSAGGRVQAFVGTVPQEDEMEVDQMPDERQGTANTSESSYFGLPRYDSPQAGALQRPEIKRNPLSAAAPRNSESSLPHSRVSTPHVDTGKTRAETLPSNIDPDGPTLLSPSELLSLVQDSSPEIPVLLLDLRVSPQYSQSRIKGALNLCIPTTLLKRPAFNLKKLADTFNSPDDKAKFNCWQQASHIVVYDVSSSQLRDAQSCINTIKKFKNEGYKGDCHILKGGFHAVNSTHPDLVERSRPGGASSGGLRLPFAAGNSSSAPLGMPVAGGCPMPESDDKPANPFFGNIRQNMDLLDGVGQMPVKRPAQLGASNLRGLPQWLRDIADEEEEGKLASERFLEIEKKEQSRMQQAYSTKVHYSNAAPHETAQGQARKREVQIAGIEKGTKNRYKDMLPYEHTRVKLQHTDSDNCDYINASHVKVQWSHREYIASQAPVPSTFKDFWRLVWEQDVRVIVTLTAQSENGQRKCHPYWDPNTYGHFKVKHLSEKTVSLERPDRISLLDPNRKVSMPLSAMGSKDNYARMQRRATLMGEGDLNTATNGGPESQTKEPASCIVRRLTLSDIQQPFVPLREVTQVEYTNWPDFGAPAEAGELLTLVEQVNSIIRASNNAGKGRKDSESVSSPTLPSGFGRLEDDESKLPAPPNERPVIVHCSAGCGRTGTFVTIDSVIDMLKRQRLVAHQRRETGRGQPGHTVRIPGGAGAGTQGEANPFEIATAQQFSPTNLETIVSPTMKMDLDSPKKGKGRGRMFASIDQRAIGVQQIDSDDDDDDDDDDDEEDGVQGEDLSSQDWVLREDIDLVQKAVEELRTQRLSMVQNLRQFTLCYESILEWLVREMPERFRRGQFRKSFQG